MWRGLILILAMAVAAPALAQPCAPGTLTRIVYRNVSPGLAAEAPQAQPRTLWRQGALFLRSELQPTPGAPSEPLVIVAEPEIWMIDPVKRSGQRSLDPGPMMFVSAPILAMPEVPAAFRALEFGCEAAFIAAHAPQPAGNLNWGSRPAARHVLADGGHTLTVIMDRRSKRPLMLTYDRDGATVIALRYDDYDDKQPPQKGLFAPPRGMKITDVPGTAVVKQK